jgi:hypothetical protein
MTQVQQHTVQLRAAATLALESGLILPHGSSFVGYSRRLALTYRGEAGWTDPEYFLSLTAQELRRLGKDPGAVLSADFDVTRHVRLGQIVVA